MTRRGLTLLELLVAMILTGILAWLALGMFTGESANYRRTREKVKMQADAREAIRILEEELRNAGFASKIVGTSRISQSVSQCTEPQFSASGEAIQGVNTSSRTSGDEVTVRYYEIPPSGVLTACGTGSSSQFREIGYRLRSGRLERRYRTDPTDASVSWIPFLENVVSFQIQYGMVTAVADYPTNLTPSLTSDPARWSGFAGSALTIGGTSPEVALSGFATTTKTALVTQTIDTAKAGEAYKVSFDASANDAFLDATNGYDTAWPANNAGLRLAFVRSDNTEPTSVAFRAPLISGTYQHYEMFLDVNGGGIGTLNVAVKGRLRAGATAGTQALTLKNFSIRRANRANYFRWTYNPTSAEMAQVGAIRIFLLVDTPEANGEAVVPTFTARQLGDTTMGDYTASGAAATRSHILYERIIPVVNNVL